MLRLPLTALAITLTAGSAFAQASGDGFQGPRVFSDLALDHSLAATNRTLIETYTRNDAIEGLVVADTPDFSDLAVAVLDQPEPADLETAPPMIVDEFVEILGDTSLDAAIAEIGTTQGDRDRHLFIKVARASNSDLEDQIEDGLADLTEFGPAITGDKTLDAKMVHVLDLISPEDTGKLPDIGPALVFSDATLEAYTAALATPPIDL
ncbi:MAG: hypothetical protein AAGG56_06855 [Pseudomonadota bacterium]